MNISNLFNKTVSTLRSVTTKDSGGSPISTFSENIASLKCRIQKRKGYEPVEGGRKFSKPAWVLYCASDTDLLIEDKISYNGIEYNVIESDIEGNDNTYLRVEMEKSE